MDPASKNERFEIGSLCDFTALSDLSMNMNHLTRSHEPGYNFMETLPINLETLRLFDTTKGQAIPKLSKLVDNFNRSCPKLRHITVITTVLVPVLEERKEESGDASANAEFQRLVKTLENEGISVRVQELRLSADYEYLAKTSNYLVERMERAGLM
jgi:MFS superfamily sulfate permease-like transporter